MIDVGACINITKKIFELVFKSQVLIILSWDPSASPGELILFIELFKDITVQLYCLSVTSWDVGIVQISLVLRQVHLDNRFEFWLVLF